ncbi:hypothetical protein DL764_000117 [Monosporascus ibericus]|uniref:C2 NT-type domain-containing protein n=1 Tax=Monosporascus ibericus TaxID=155417 RepID=A0A4V1XCX8_9PEZI|nr:hypothetical protein DL764_000117 [Monosporascus ibericus]
MHAEHRGRTAKSAIDKANHRATYSYSKIVPLRIPIDRNNNLTECPIEFEVIQELPAAPGAKDERITLGLVRLNLSEYVEESENLHRGTAGATRFGANLEAVRDKEQNVGQGLSHRRLSSKSSVGTGGAGVNPLGLNLSGQQSQQQALHSEENDVVDEEAEEGIVRRYLMQDSKINSTLKVGILMVQVDGERNYVAPALKSAPMFGGIAGIVAGERAAATEPVHHASTGASTAGALPSLGKSRDVSEVQDMYRRTLAASWACQPGELPADECIEDIFSGGDGWRNSHKPSGPASHDIGRRTAHHLDAIADDESPNSNGNSGDGSPDDATAKGGLRPSDFRRPTRRHMRQRSGSSNHSDRSNKSTLTVLDEDRGRPPSSSSHQYYSQSHYNLPLRHQPQNTRPQLFRGDRGEDGGSTSLLRPGSQHGGLDNNDGHGHSLRPRRGLASLAPAPAPASRSSSRGRGESFGNFRPQKEVDEYEVREDLVAWYLPGTAAAM